MPKGPPQVVRNNIEKCRSAALAAVDSYNRPGPQFRTAQYLVFIIIAWTALFHAIFYHGGRRPWYRRSGSGPGTRYLRIDGEPKHWDLTECLQQHFGDRNPPERQNLTFLVGLRNKIEHRHLPALDPSLYGECQAALLNLETYLSSTFGQRYALTEQLAISLQFSQALPDQKQKAIKALASSAAKTVTEYITTFRASLDSPTLNSMRYSYSVFLIPRVVNRQAAADAAVQFIAFDDASPAELQRLDNLNVLIKEKQIPTANLDLLKPSEVVKELNSRLPFSVNQTTHTRAWKHHKVRPIAGDAHPHRTRQEYCVYDATHKDYLYTKAWTNKLARDLVNPDDYRRVTGLEPRFKTAPKPSGP